MSFKWIPIQNEKVFLVGGSVRDSLLGIPSNDKDWVVVGATPNDLLSRGFLQIGADFPVFLHPKTKEEYALARTERKVGNGHKDFEVYFSPDVSLEDDLSRRDLTINAMAQSASGEIIDPYEGKKDLENKILRHVGKSFIEDPLRILRVARFAARYHDFTIHDTTLELMKDMVKEGVLQHLPSERIVTEIQKSFDTPKPWIFFDILRKINGDTALFGQPLRVKDIRRALERPKVRELSPTWQQAIAFANSGITSYQALSLSLRYKFPKDLEHGTQFLIQYSQDANFLASDNNFAWKTCSALDGFRRPERVTGFIQALSTQTELDFSKLLSGLSSVTKLHIGEHLVGVPNNEKQAKVEHIRKEAFKAGWNATPQQHVAIHKTP